LTGNIATGKSVVRKMLEHLGAYGIDADALANRAILKGSPGYQPVVETFGTWILGGDGQVDRVRLGRLVFSDQEALRQLEVIVHPLVGEAIDILVRRSSQPVVVIEAIKLLESGLGGWCDSIWVTYAPADQQLARLTRKRGMNEAMARQRMNAQSAQEKKIAHADVVIRNLGSFEDTWNQVLAVWYRLVPAAEVQPLTGEQIHGLTGDVTLERALPRDSSSLVGLINRTALSRRVVSSEDVMAAFGDKAFLLLKVDGQLLGIAGWKVENLVARIDEIYVDRSLVFAEAAELMVNEIERVSRDLQCEISLLFLPQELTTQEPALVALGYERCSVEELGVQPWEEAALESMPAGSMLLFKKLREDRILRPV
jgi:dephospho-CoA kinase